MFKLKSKRLRKHNDYVLCCDVGVLACPLRCDVTGALNNQLRVRLYHKNRADQKDNFLHREVESAELMPVYWKKYPYSEFNHGCKCEGLHIANIRNYTNVNGKTVDRLYGEGCHHGMERRDQFPTSWRCPSNKKDGCKMSAKTIIGMDGLEYVLHSGPTKSTTELPGMLRIVHCVLC